MNKYLLIYFLVGLQSSGAIYAQWTKKDSVWLEDVLSGKEEIKLNPETMKAIRSGKFINLEEQATQPLAAPPILPITKTFTDIAPPDSVNHHKNRNVDPRTMPPSVYALYHSLGYLEPDTGLKMKREAFTSNGPLLPKEEIRLGKSPVTVKAGAGNLFLEEVRDGQRRGSLNTSVRVKFSLNDILLSIFSPKERNKKRNKRRAAETLRYYNNLD